MAQHHDLVSEIDVRQCWALNENKESQSTLGNCLTAELRMLPDRCLKSDCDEELLIHIVFVQKARVHRAPCTRRDQWRTRSAHAAHSGRDRPCPAVCVRCTALQNPPLVVSVPRAVLGAVCRVPCTMCRLPSAVCHAPCAVRRRCG